MSKWAPFAYCGFYDVPLVIITSDGTHTYLFDRPFDEQLDDYQPDYDVYLVPNEAFSHASGEWETLLERANCRLGRLPASGVRFDPSRRRLIDLEILEQLKGGVP